MPARTGIFGGSFDPIHNGHIQLAEAAIRQARLEQLLLMPAAAQPLKPRGPIASSADRVEMARRAIAGRPEIQVSTHEVDRGGISYTFETLEVLQSSFPDHRLLLVLGADALLDLPRWRRPDRILAIASLLVVDRPGSDRGLVQATLDQLPAARDRLEWISMPPCDVSSTEIRKLAAQGKAIGHLVPAVVAKYIEEHRLYGSSSQRPDAAGP